MFDLLLERHNSICMKKRKKSKLLQYRFTRIAVTLLLIVKCLISVSMTTLILELLSL